MRFSQTCSNTTLVKSELTLEMQYDAFSVHYYTESLLPLLQQHPYVT